MHNHFNDATVSEKRKLYAEELYNSMYKQAYGMGGVPPHLQRKEGEVLPWDNQKLVNEGWPDGKPLPDYGEYKDKQTTGTTNKGSRQVKNNLQGNGKQNRISQTTDPTITIEKPITMPAITIDRPDKTKASKPTRDLDYGGKALVNKYVNRKQNTNPPGAANTGKHGKYVDDGSKALAGTYKPVNHALKPSWFKDDGSKALAGTYKYKPVNHSTKPSWYKDDGSKALAGTYKYKPVNHSTKPSWYKDDGSKALT